MKRNNTLVFDSIYEPSVDIVTLVSNYLYLIRGVVMLILLESVKYLLINYYYHLIKIVNLWLIVYIVLLLFYL